MTREEFEREYAFRHMSYDPREINSKISSVHRLRKDNGYTDSHIDLCWRIQLIKGIADRGLMNRELMKLEW